MNMAIVCSFRILVWCEKFNVLMPKVLGSGFEEPGI